MKKITVLILLLLLCSFNYSCNTIAGTAKGIAEDVKSVVPGIQMIRLLILFIVLFLFGCNTVVGSVKGIGRDMKAATVYTRDAFTGNPISDESSK